MTILTTTPAAPQHPALLPLFHPDRPSISLTTDRARPHVDHVDDAVAVHGDVLLRDHLDRLLRDHPAQERRRVRQVCGRRACAVYGSSVTVTTDLETDEEGQEEGDLQLADGALEVFGELDVVADELAHFRAESVDGHS